MDGLKDRQLAAVCKALGHPARIKIIKQLLREKGCVCGRIVQLQPLAQSTVSQHLKVLKDAGLVKGEITGKMTCYCVNKPVLVRTLETLSSLTGLEKLHE